MEASNNFLKNESSKYADEIKESLEYPLSDIKVLGNALNTIIEESPNEKKRALVNTALKNYIASNKNIYGVWVGFEPNALDGMDSIYANTDNYDNTGSFFSYWIRENNDISFVKSNYSEDVQRDYYALPKNKGSEIVTKPYVYEVEGEKLIMNACFHLVDRDEVVVVEHIVKHHRHAQKPVGACRFQTLV